MSRTAPPWAWVCRKWTTLLIQQANWITLIHVIKLFLALDEDRLHLIPLAWTVAQRPPLPVTGPAMAFDEDVLARFAMCYTLRPGMIAAPARKLGANFKRPFECVSPHSVTEVSRELLGLQDEPQFRRNKYYGPLEIQLMTPAVTQYAHSNSIHRIRIWLRSFQKNYYKQLPAFSRVQAIFDSKFC